MFKARRGTLHNKKVREVCAVRDILVGQWKDVGRGVDTLQE